MKNKFITCMSEMPVSYRIYTEVSGKGLYEKLENDIRKIKWVISFNERIKKIKKLRKIKKVFTWVSDFWHEIVTIRKYDVFITKRWFNILLFLPHFQELRIDAALFFGLYRKFLYNEKHFVRQCIVRREENSVMALLTHVTKAMQISRLEHESCFAHFCSDVAKSC